MSISSKVPGSLIMGEMFSSSLSQTAFSKKWLDSQ